MKIEIKRTLLVILLALGIIWDCLCMLKVIPFSYYAFSAVLIAGYSLLISCGFILLPFAKYDEKSSHYPELSSKEKALSGISIGLSAAWLCTFIACIAYPL